MLPSGSSDTAIDVRAALQQLVPEQQAALVLVDMLGYSVAPPRCSASHRER
jgi:RNA polymerase sigma-70 factor (ECF subfamily)